MRHAPPARARLWRVAALAAVLLAAWGVGQQQTVSAHASLPRALRPQAPSGQTPAAQGPAVQAATRASTSDPVSDLPAATGRPDDEEDHSSALAPIALGLVLTGIASYKHRGLPRGH
jgi:hypothetical protein